MIFAASVWVLVIWSSAYGGFSTELRFADKASCEHFSRELEKHTQNELVSACMRADNLAIPSGKHSETVIR